jgi:hypothetical protein
MINKVFNNAAIFVTTYIIFMLPTYFLPYLRTTGSALYGLDNADANMLNFAFFVHLVSMVVLCWICLVRGLL